MIFNQIHVACFDFPFFEDIITVLVHPHGRFSSSFERVLETKIKGCGFKGSKLLHIMYIP